MRWGPRVVAPSHMSVLVGEGIRPSRPLSSPHDAVRQWVAMRTTGLLICVLAGCARTTATDLPDILLSGRPVRAAPGPTLALMVGLDEAALPLGVLEADEQGEREVVASFLRTGGGFVARGAPTFGEPSLLEVSVANDRLVASDSRGKRVALSVPGVAVVVAAGRPVVAAGDVVAPCILLRERDAVVVEAGTVRLSGVGAVVVGTNVRIGIESGVVALSSSVRQTGAEPVIHQGVIDPPTAGVGVAAIGLLGEPLGAGVSDARGSFTVVAKPGAARLFAVLGEGRASAVTASHPGVRLALFPLGHVRVSVRDEDSDRLLPARIFVHAEAGTREPSFGPPFRASGAGSLLDVEAGVLDSPLPEGSYRVLATHGPEWTVDAENVTLIAGQHAHVALRLRHVVATPGLAACDFHVHSGAGFDSDVTVEDRVRTLASVGVDFAVPSEHNRVGTYAAAGPLGLGGDLGWAPGVEVTTSSPKGGHFNVFPYPLLDPPAHQRTSLERLIGFVRGKIPGAVIQVNHPRLGDGMGYYDLRGQDPHTLASKQRVDERFDTLEVYNGFDLPRRDRAEAVLTEWLALFEAGRPHWATGNSDSHTSQYLWAGFPRTYVAVLGDHEDGAGPPVAAGDVVAALLRGRATVTSGPLIDLRVGDAGEAGPGDTADVVTDTVRAHIRVRTAPWVDARSVSVLVGGKEVFRRDLGEAPVRIGREPGSLVEARHRALRYDEAVRVPVREGDRTLVVVVRGERNLSTVLPYLDALPFAFTNPVRFRHR